MIEVDRIMIEELQIELKQMMENAGRNLAYLVQRLYRPARACVLAGSGGNGGGGLVAARHLANHGVDIQVLLSRAAQDMTGVPAHQLGTLQRMGVVVTDQALPALDRADVVIDALVGYSLRGAPRGRAHDLIDAANTSATPVVSLDVPSGVDSTSGESPGVAVHAQATLTLAAPKLGLRTNAHVGRMFVGDISVPSAVYDQMGLTPRVSFANDAWVVEVKA